MTLSFSHAPQVICSKSYKTNLHNIFRIRPPLTTSAITYYHSSPRHHFSSWSTYVLLTNLLLRLLCSDYFHKNNQCFISKRKADHIVPLLKSCQNFPSPPEKKQNFLILTMSYKTVHNLVTCPSNYLSYFGPHFSS